MVHIKKHIGLLVCLFLLINQEISAQNFNNSRGLPFTRNYLPEEYHAHEKNFDILQSDNGLMYFANFAGVLEFDGSSWNKIVSSSGMRIVSLAKGKDGRIFAGGLYDFGYLETNKKGMTRFVSLLENQNDYKDIGLIFKVICSGDKCYFFSENRMIIYNGSKIEKIAFEGQLMDAFIVNEDIYLFFNPEKENIKYHGLYLYKQQFQKINVPEGISMIDVCDMVPLAAVGQILVISSSQGLFLLENNLIKEFDAPVNELLKNKKINSAAKVQKSMVALGTAADGVLLIDSEGKLIQLIDRASGLNDESINKVYADKTGSLWMATDNGISKAEMIWPISYIDNKSSGLEGKVQDIEKFNNKLYFATDKGLFFLESDAIRKINNLDVPCYSLLKAGNDLYVGTSRGIFSVATSHAIKQISEQFTFSLTQSSLDENRIFSGHSKFVNVYGISGNALKLDYSIGNIQGDVLKILEDEDGVLFFEATPGKIYVYQPDTKKLIDVTKESGFLNLHLNRKGSQIFISSEKGLFMVNKSSSGMEPFFLLPGDSISHKVWMYEMFELTENHHIFTDGEQKQLSFLDIDKNKMTINQTPFLPLADFSAKTIWYDNQTGQIWAGGKDGLIIDNQKDLFDYSVHFKTIIRKITILGKDSAIDLDGDRQHRIRYVDNSLTFEYSAPVYPVIGQVQYRYFLKGFDKDSSAWSNLNKKEYTNLPDGQYEFIVEARNEFGMKAQLTSYKFRILTPIYRQWWAILIYLTILIAGGRWFIVWRGRIARKEKERLEALVKERTEEIERSKEKIEEQRDIAYRQKKEILDSISYAQRIQQAVLPSPQLAEDILLEHFILYRPRDIVSGDFYWMKKINNYVAVVAADCTGHGVPGAFMSMLGSSFLNEIVTRRSLDNAAQILNRLRSKVKKSLHQEGKEGEQKDGMDIALLIIDSETLELQYAGAYNPLYIIRSNQGVNLADESIDIDQRYEFIQLKADRQPIGIHLNEKDFTNHVFQLKNGDSIYSFSDGYVDQFGGETGEKFKHKRFRDLLMSVQGKPMMEQKQMLEHAFVRWKRDIAQIDDVLVMGIKI